MTHQEAEDMDEHCSIRMLNYYFGYDADYLIYHGSEASCSVWMIPDSQIED